MQESTNRPQRTPHEQKPRTTAGTKSTSAKKNVASRETNRKEAQRVPMSSDERRRQRALRAKKKRQRRNRIVALVVTLILIVVGVVLCLTVFFHVKTVKVVGDEPYVAEQIIEASGVHVGENMFLMRSKKIAAHVEKELPYIESVKIKRKISGEVQLVIEAAVPKAAISTENGYILLNAVGKVLETEVAEIDDTIIVITDSTLDTAVEGERVTFLEPENAEILKTVFPLLAENNLTGITALQVNDVKNIQMTYENRIVLKLGELSSLPDKMDFVVAALQRNEEKMESFRGTMDFTIDKKAFLHPEEESKKEEKKTETTKEAENVETTTAA